MIDIQDIPASLRDAAQRAANACLAEVAGVTAVVIATVDGFDLAAAFRGDQDAARIAAMASSISAISSVVAMEAGLGQFKHVIIGTTSGFAIVQAVHRADIEMVIHVIADGNAIVAQAMHRAGAIARLLAAVTL
jgi:predicted regulator of Ras-like GTPase activity (Roadblock/LC7/MglB family)